LDAPFYATSWALFSYLTNRRPDDLLRYIQRLVGLPKRDQAAAWPAVFPDLTPDKLDRILDDWIKTGDLTVHQYKIKLRDFAVAQRVLGDGEILTARALLRFVTGGRPETELAAALAADPDNVIANMLNMARNDHVEKPSLVTAQRLTVTHPDDWRAWWLHQQATEDGGEAKRDMAHVCALLARTPAILPGHGCSSVRPTR
jgi:hypothetical protein